MSGIKTQPRERPIIFSGEMVRQIMSGHKTQARRRITRLTGRHRKQITEFRPSSFRGCDWTFRNGLGEWEDITTQKLLELCPYGNVGDLLWVREASIITPPGWGDGVGYNRTDDSGRPRIVQYLADGQSTEAARDFGLKPRAPMFMPRWASRILLKIEGIRFERVQDVEQQLTLLTATVDAAFAETIKILKKHTAVLAELVAAVHPKEAAAPAALDNKAGMCIGCALDAAGWCEHFVSTPRHKSISTPREAVLDVARLFREYAEVKALK